MLHKTRGIIFRATDYGESSVIVQIFTEKFGLQSYIINSAKKPKAKIGRNMLQPLHLLDLVVYHKNTGSVQRISELKNAPVLLSIPYDVIKSCIAIFLNEVLYKAIKQQSPDENLFDFIFSAIEWLDHQTESVANFHLIFLTRLTRYLGFYPDRYMAGEADYFDIKNGQFTRYKPESISYLSPPHTDNFRLVLQTSFEDMHLLKLSNDERRYLVQKLLEYYAMHIEGFGNIKSADVLEEVLA
ncbi:DNA repair protein RecO [Mucilaginibacter rubeus]|uniref:DNA repair protein RecO n=1 Tax=Mucilaginibacter rubeus TaxID=2027860 RepID=A0AAE6JIZ0_9SPHI|nr:MULTISPECIES: DNA repair protein RecO [Mucilaginibacter]QEM06536.1 DNA repair protein RecO [Mucilaginibacter rubeus]QEM19125.1 DNA repair protein RecO [Mucilaginibacter gossypii]QTE44334.1 DNA repair protein RecO [Mucilaginibacter rubeus]QTE50934.1 DNA repair protein RecO [Mucilaginibacter rubeus]QTE56017.1 DNA repair protein RecO [Mucilaginibacter rubeus]